ncbi:MAG: MobF family relaxase [Solirubrobacteraceae bacterium]
MLSIGKLRGNAADYYERGVACGQDDYYTGAGESPGRWTGAGAERLGLAGEIADGQLSKLVRGLHPVTGQRLREVPDVNPDKVIGALDLTFSAPKSVSVLYALADERTAATLVDCHEQAVDAALGYMESTAVFVRRGKGGTTVVQTGGLIVGAFRHRLSRARDPQLHTHAVCANFAEGPDGRITSLFGKEIYAAAKTGGYAYQSELRAQISEWLGLEWGAVSNGAAELVSISPEARDAFSTRKREIEDASKESHLAMGGPAAAQFAVKTTRAAKQQVDTPSWRAEVQRRAVDVGLDRDRVAEITAGRDTSPETIAARRARQASTIQDPELGDRLTGAQGLTEYENTFDRHAVIRALAQAASQGAHIPELQEQADRFVADRDDVLSVSTSVAGDRGRRWSARNLIRCEQQLVDDAVGRAGERCCVAADKPLRDVRRGCGLSEEQWAIVEKTARSGHGVEAIEAHAGTGKTRVAGVLRAVYESDHYEVIGIAPTGRARRELKEEAGLAKTVTLKAQDIKLAAGGKLSDGCVLLVDEAGMCQTRQTARLLAAARDARAKVIVIGDSGQLPSVQAGGWLRGIHQRMPERHTLVEVHRQRDKTERRVLGALHAGNPGPWIAWAGKHARKDHGGGGLDGAIAKWTQATQQVGYKDAVLIARSNETRNALNQAARAIARERGHLEDREVTYDRLAISVGDRVICRINDRDLDVDNGTRGTVTEIDGSGVTIATDAGTTRHLPGDYIRSTRDGRDGGGQALELAYALTVHGTQGGTVETAIVVAEPHELTQGMAYTALSRARGQTFLFLQTEGREDRERTEIAPREVRERQTDQELDASLARYMKTPDSEEMAIEQRAHARGVARERDRGYGIEL